MDSKGLLTRLLRGLSRCVALAIPGGVAALMLALAAQAIAGCAGNTFPLTGATWFQVRQISPGIIAMSTPATASDTVATWTPSVTMPRLAIQNLTGPAVFVEGVLAFNADGSTTAAFPVKQQVAGFGPQEGPIGADTVVNNLFIDVPVDLGEVERFRQEQLGPGGTAPPGRFTSFNAVVLWKNAVGQDNFRAGQFDPICFCYSADPTLKQAGSEIIPTSNRVTVSYNVTFTIGTGGGGS